jgi:hypothetical protein
MPIPMSGVMWGEGTHELDDDIADTRSLLNTFSKDVKARLKELTDRKKEAGKVLRSPKQPGGVKQIQRSHSENRGRQCTHPNFNPTTKRLRLHPLTFYLLTTPWLQPLIHHVDFSVIQPPSTGCSGLTFGNRHPL